jgi:hypothetical protein
MAVSLAGERTNKEATPHWQRSLLVFGPQNVSGVATRASLLRGNTRVTKPTGCSARLESSIYTKTLHTIAATAPHVINTRSVPG